MTDAGPPSAEGRLEDLLAAGQAAMEEGDWAAGRRAFEAALEREEVAEALLGLGDAAWWLGDTELSVRSSERAFALFRRRPDHASAAFAAVGLYFVYRVSLGNVAASRGWLARAASLVEEAGLEPLEGWVLLMRAHDAAAEPAASEELARRALELAREAGDVDLRLCALSQLGAALVGRGRIADGVAMLDEAMAGSLAGEGMRRDTVVYAACSMITACSQVAELERAAQWIRAADDFTRRYGSPHLYTLCRTYYGGLLFGGGRWAEAERELEAALRTGQRAERALHGEALARLAELRLAQGRAEEAAQLLAGFEDDVAAAPVVAALHLAAGRPAVAAALLRRRLREWAHEAGVVAAERTGAAAVIARAVMMELLVEAEAARGDAAEAAAEARRLAGLATALGWELVTARAERALGRARGAAGDDAGAAGHLERALASFVRLALPLEAARTRLLLSAALRGTEREAAVVEARAALAAFEGLGAGADADRAAGLLRGLGERAARAGPRGDGGLTKREREVLRLLGEGLSNRQIADRLYLSVKTVEHHVRAVFMKLGISSRAAAAAYAARHPEGGSSAG